MVMSLEVLVIEPVDYFERKTIDRDILKQVVEVGSIGQRIILVIGENRIFPNNVDLTTGSENPAINEIECEGVVIDIVNTLTVIVSSAVGYR